MAISQADISAEKILQELNYLQENLRAHRERVRHIEMVKRHSFVKEYRDGRLSLILDVPTFWNVDIPRRRVPCSGDEPGLGLTSFIFHFKPIDRGIIYDWEQKPVLVTNVQSVNGVDGVIPSVVGLYLVKDKAVQVGAGGAYFGVREKVFKVFCRGGNRKLGSIINDAGSQSLKDRKPCVVERGFEIVNYIPDHQSYVPDGFNISQVMLNELLSGLRIYLNDGEVGIFENGDSRFNIRDVFLGPFNFEA